MDKVMNPAREICLSVALQPLLFEMM